MSRGETVRYGPVLYRDYPIGTLGLMDDGLGVSRVFLRREGVQYDFPEGERAWQAAGRGEREGRRMRESGEDAAPSAGGIQAE